MYQDFRLIARGTKVLDNREVMYRKTNPRHKIPGGFFRFEQAGTKATVYGFGYGDYIRLRDQYGNTWQGSAEQGADDSVRYRFRGPDGDTITGISDNWGLILRDQNGRTWRGFVE